jgi:hypothetical protein
MNRFGTYPRFLYLDFDLFSMGDNRSAVRRDFFARAVVGWQNETKSYKEPGLIEDRSTSGLGMRMNSPVAVGTTVDVRMVNQSFSGIVRRCAALRSGYLVGVELLTHTVDSNAHTPK